ncbi:hypothetical protein TNIN_108211 [Trichonephila inaurata madagascariensis]|uniref:Uncharacterized protein n=1 Tax=Trichonephila inaurata madagascariensis TaxID=2747483 RepID=A0A8X6WNL9_9ARAC|nr:hypothetical protein TNIN_108211 [Trichonephila inaurata madagascariensis]
MGRGTFSHSKPFEDAKVQQSFIVMVADVIMERGNRKKDGKIVCTFSWKEYGAVPNNWVVENKDELRKEWKKSVQIEAGKPFNKCLVSIGLFKI